MAECLPIPTCRGHHEIYQVDGVYLDKKILIILGNCLMAFIMRGFEMRLLILSRLLLMCCNFKNSGQVSVGFELGTDWSDIAWMWIASTHFRVRNLGIIKLSLKLKTTVQFWRSIFVVSPPIKMYRWIFPPFFFFRGSTDHWMSPISYILFIALFAP